MSDFGLTQATVDSLTDEEVKSLAAVEQELRELRAIAGSYKRDIAGGVEDKRRLVERDGVTFGIIGRDGSFYSVGFHAQVVACMYAGDRIATIHIGSDHGRLRVRSDGDQMIVQPRAANVVHIGLEVT